MQICVHHTVIFIWIFTLNVRLLTNINRRAFTFPCIILFLYTITELTESLLLWLKTLQRASSVCYHDLPAFNYCFNGLFFSSCQNPAINFIAWRQYIHHIFLCSVWCCVSRSIQCLIKRSLVLDRQNKVLQYTSFSYFILECVEFCAKLNTFTIHISCKLQGIKYY